MPEINKRQQGKRNRANGAIFEKRVREDLESKGFFVSKFQNNVDLEKGIMIAAKGNRFKARSVGFPDFIVWGKHKTPIAVESKIGKYLDKQERAKCRILLKQKVFRKIFVAFKTKEKNKVKVNYYNFLGVGMEEK